MRARSKRPPRAANSQTHHGMGASPISLGKTSVVTWWLWKDYKLDLCQLIWIFSIEYYSRKSHCSNVCFLKSDEIESSFVLTHLVFNGQRICLVRKSGNSCHQLWRDRDTLGIILKKVDKNGELKLEMKHITKILFLNILNSG